MILLGYYCTGLRVTELASLKLSQFDIGLEKIEVKNPHIVVRGKSNKERFVLLNKKAIEALNEYLVIRSFFDDENNIKQQLYLFCSSSKQGYMTRQN